MSRAGSASLRRPSLEERRQAVLAAADLRGIAQRAGTVLAKVGPEDKGRCPVCGGGGFTIYRKGARWHCFSACDTGGNAIDLAMRIDGLPFLAAIEKLEAENGLADRFASAAVYAPPSSALTAAALAARAAVAEKAAKQRAAEAAEEEAKRKRILARACKIWDEARPLVPSTVSGRGDLGWRYLCDRGLDMGLLARTLVPDTLRLHPGLGHPAEWNEAAGTFGRRWPALLARVTDAAGDTIAVQTIWLDPEPQAAPPAVADFIGSASRIWRPPLDPSKRALGAWSGGACRLFAPVPGRPLAIAEGIEKALAYRQLYGVPCWAAMFAANFHGLAEALIALTCLRQAPSEIVFACDANAPLANKKTGRVIAADGISIFHARKGAAKLVAAGVAARIVKPPAGSDWSDVLVAQLSGAKACGHKGGAA
jgi:hypothetical protein